MSRQVNINLAFTADTAQAKAQLQSLQQQLTSLINSPVGLGQTLTTDIQKATAAAAELKMHLQNATNIKTGTLDFGKLNQSLKASGTTLNHYAAQLQKLGPLGQQSFMQLARSVSMAEVPLKRSGALLQSLGTTLANTAKWQISSSLLHGFIRSVSSAYNYSKELNQSLNNIRIVTGKNIDEMSKFAEEANKAAKSLSTTTTEYTNASLIYYQQGLSDSEVKERTNATIKMANVTRQSAEIVSDQMTAIWNNFDDGSRSLEYYADVLTALGAATASSTDEIAQGLEKFAAVAETVGLSYEYATAALATVTATTRQSADVVGTAFKTLFARIQDLELGNTLDDGTTLGKYSEALFKVGINIKDSNGELKDMNNILDEMGQKWDKLDKDQQVALAKSVAGIRQYTQLIALMDNWDFMKKNLNTVAESSGTLSDQAKTYSESWEAASKRVKASLETIYEAIMDDKFFIKLTDDFANLIDKIGGFVKSIGGLQGVLAGLGMILTKVFHQQLAQGFSNLAYNIAMSTKAGAEAVQQAKIATMEQFANSMNSYNESTAVGRTSKQVYTEELQMQSQLQINAKNLTQEEQLKLKYMMDQTRAIGEQSIKLAEQVDIQKQLNSDRKTQLMGNALMAGNSMQDVTAQFRNVEKGAASIGHITAQLRDMRNASEISEQSVNELSVKLKELGFGKNEITNLTSGLQGLQGASTDAGLILDNIAASVSRVSSEMAETIVNLMGFRQGAEGYTEARQRVEEYLNGLYRTVTLQKDLKTSVDNGTQSAKQFGNALVESGQKGQQSMSQLFATMTSGLMSAGMLISSINGLIDTIKNPDTTGWQKFGQILTSVSMITLSLMGVFKGVKAIIGVVKGLTTGETIAKIANATATWAQVAAEEKLNKTKTRSANTTRNSTRNTIKDTWNKNARAAYKGRYEKVDNVMINGANGTEVGGYRNKNTGQIISKSQYSSGLKGAGKSALKSVGTKLGGAAIVVAAVVASAAIIKAASDHYNRFEIAAQKAQETANAMQQTYETVSSAETDFRNTIDNYSSGVKGLEELTKGTEEYKNAVREANNEAVKLLNTHKNLKYEINDEGLIEIDESSLQTAIQNSFRKEARANAAALISQQQADNAKLEADKVNFQRTQMKTGGIHWDEDDTTIAAGGYGASGVMAAGAVGYTAVTGGLAAVGAANAWNPVGWIMLGVAALGAIITTVALQSGNDADAREARTLEALETFSTASGGRDLTKEEIKEIADKEDPSGKLAASLLSDVDATNNLISEMQANTEAINQTNDLIASQLLQNNEYVANSEFSAEVTDRSGEVFGNFYKEAYAEVSESDWGKYGITQATKTNSHAKNVFNEYLEYAGLSDKGYQLVNAKGSDKNRTFEYLDEQGQLKEVGLEQMYQAKATAIAESQMTAIANQMTVLFQQWSQKDDLSSQAVSSFLLKGNFEDASKNEVNNLNAEINDNHDGNVENYLKSQFGDLGELAKQLGYNSADQLVQTFTAALSNFEVIWNDIDLTGLKENISNTIEYSTAEKLQNLLTFMNTGSLGEQAGQQFIEGINTFIKDADIKDQQEILNKIMDIDWSQWNAGKQVLNILDEYGLKLNMTEQAFNDWVMTINRGNSAIFDYAQNVKDILEMEKIQKDSAFGMIITKEQYDMLINYNKELSKYFRLLGDGSYKLIGDPLDFNQSTDDAIQKARKDALIGARSNYDAVLKRQAVDQAVKDTGLTRDALKTNQWGVVGTHTEYVQKEPSEWDQTIGFLNSFIPYEIFTGGQYRAKTAEDFAGTDPVKVEDKGIINKDTYSKQIDFIDTYLPDVSDDTIKSWRNNETSDNAAAIAKKISEYLDKYQATDNTEISELAQQQFTAEVEYASQATSIKDLDNMLKEDNIQISEDAYSVASMDFITQEKWEGMDPKEVEKYADSLQGAAKSSSLLSDELENNQEAAEDVALYTKKMNQGIDKLAGGMEDWSDILKHSNEGSEEYSLAMQSMKDAMSDVLGVSENFLSDDFILDNMKDIELAAEGDAEAIDRLAIAAGKDILVNLDLQDESIRDELITLHDELAAEIPNIEVGATIDDEDFLAKAANIVESANMTVAEANAYFRSMGFEPTFETKLVDVTRTPQGTRTTRKVTKWDDALDTNGKVIGSYPAVIEESTESFDLPSVTEKIEVPALTTDGGKPNFTLTRTNAGAMNNYSSSNKGGKSPGGGSGGGSKPKKADQVKKSDVVEKYKEINDSLAENTRAMEAANRAAERLYGKDRLNKMQEVNNLLAKEIDLNNKKIDQAKDYRDESKDQLQKELKNRFGLSFTFDEYGNISNYDEVMTKVWKSQDSLITEVNKDKDVSETEQERLDKKEEDVKTITDLISTYDEDNTIIKDLLQANEEKLDEIQENNYKIITEELDIKLELNENDKKFIQRELDKLKEDVFGMAEAFAETKKLMNESKQNIGHYQTLANQAYEAWTSTDPNKKISDAKYYEALQASIDGVLNSADEWEALDEQMRNYFIDTLSMATEKLSDYTSLMEHSTSVLDHYKNILELTGSAMDFESQGIILEGSVQVTENAFRVASQEFEHWSNVAQEAKANMDASINDPEAYKQFEENWKSAQQAANDAQEQMLSSAESYAEAIVAAYENELAKLGKVFEEALTDGKGFDYLNTSIERAQSSQEEFLTTTNKVYETTKLMRNAQNEIDKTTNTVAKQKLKAFQEETEQLQNQEKLSQFELDLQQKKYDLLLAKIALEEAQNAKSTVRLQRDSEGNFGYVYTADQNQVADAQQKVDDAENALYNAQLEGVNNYTQKRVEAEQAMYDELKGLEEAYMAGEITWDEWYNRSLETKDYYTKRLKDIDYLYFTALTGSGKEAYAIISDNSEQSQIAALKNSKLATEAWSGALGIMSKSADEIMRETQKYLFGEDGNGGSYGIFTDFSNKMNEIKLSLNLDSISGVGTEVDKVKTSNDKLATHINETLLPALGEEIDAVSELATNWEKARKEQKQFIDDAIGWAKQKKDEKEEASGFSDKEEDDAVANTADQETETAQTNAKNDNTTTTTNTNDTPKINTLTNDVIKGIAAAIWCETDSGWGTGTTRENRINEKFGNGSYSQVQDYINNNLNTLYDYWANTLKGNAKKYHYSSFDTGGYTGEWGPEGRLALLHQKELVLNASQTKDLLMTMELLDNVLSQIDQMTTMQQYAFSKMEVNKAINDLYRDQISQEVHIEANFPNVTDRNEIQEAFNTLINEASQYVNRF